MTIFYIVTAFMAGILVGFTVGMKVQRHIFRDIGPNIDKLQRQVDELSRRVGLK